jgi:hypothetical protein
MTDKQHNHTIHRKPVRKRNKIEEKQLIINNSVHPYQGRCL